MRAVVVAGAVVGLTLLVATTGFVANPAAEADLSPVPFDRTLQTGMTGVDVQQAEAAGHAIPRGQVFYSQYEYVVGFYGIDALLAGTTGRYTEQFGRPLAAHVTDFAGTDPTLTAAGYLNRSRDAPMGWTRATDAWYVVGTAARTPAGPTPVPFGDRDAATAFAREYDGEVLDWETLSDRRGSRSATGPPASPTDERLRWADRQVRGASAIRERPVSVTVGEDAPTVAAAVERAPPNTTVRIPPGQYDVNLTVTKPITLEGAGTATVLDGGGNGTVLTAATARVGVTDLRVTGVGDRELVSVDENEVADDPAWDSRIRLVYGRGDAGIRLSTAPGSLVENVTVQTDANGVVVFDSPGAVVRRVRIDGRDGSTTGGMGVLAMYSRMVIADTTVDGGADGVYTHHADGLVVRDSAFRGMRYGVHEMYTSDTLLVNNTITGADIGIFVMTRPTGNAIVGNRLRDNGVGVETAGTASATVDNVAVGNQVGISIGTSRSVVANNTVAANGVGLRSTTLFPTNDVTGNDVVANDRPVEVDLGRLTVWAVDGRGNYWGSVPGTDRDGDGVVDRAFRPTDALDSRARVRRGEYVLAHATAVELRRAFQQAVPGLRPAAVVDPAPLAAPTRPERLDRLNVSTRE
ncbi:NosD domain-containing protein [Halorientalis pallida]|uniref:Copper-binding protein n=1 Tax=Halorientalis pallida TaxID=2479928 RepID=A0A498KWL8_9EURY|nr:NosD domain-containing protein [Halorientalis pallida]RXK49225.1 copper-binding protein [Halorientalis pallida]